MMPHVCSGWHPPLLKRAASVDSRVLQLPYVHSISSQYGEIGDLPGSVVVKQAFASILVRYVSISKLSQPILLRDPGFPLRGRTFCKCRWIFGISSMHLAMRSRHRSFLPSNTFERVACYMRFQTTSSFLATLAQHRTQHILETSLTL